MKFACDRCHTRYSIADERVKGKILKIRCKNCSNLISVREGMPEPAPAPSGRTQRPTTMAPPRAHEGEDGPTTPDAGISAVIAASAAAKREDELDGVVTTPAAASPSAARKAPPAPPPASGPVSADSTIDVEWYVSRDGEQSGPFDLEAAQAWVREQPAGADLHCWNDGFDEWLPVHKVGHFRGLREAKPPAPPPKSAGPIDFDGAATMHDDERPSASGFDAAITSDGSTSDDDLSIGEVSRVVRIADLAKDAAKRAPASRATPVAGLPGPALTATAPDADQLAAAKLEESMTAPLAAKGLPLRAPPSPTGPPDRGLTATLTSKSHLPLLLIGLVLIGGAAIVLLKVMRRGDDDDVVDNGTTGDDYGSLSHRPGRNGGQPTTPPGPVASTGATGTTGVAIKATGTTAPTGVVHKPTGATGITASTGKNPIDPAAEPLAPGDVEEMSRKMGGGQQRCYEQAMKKDPFLDVKSIKVTLTVTPQGTVTGITLSDHADDLLGTCLKKSIGGWHFRTSSEGITTRLTMVFQKT